MVPASTFRYPSKIYRGVNINYVKTAHVAPHYIQRLPPSWSEISHATEYFVQLIDIRIVR